MQQFMLVAGIGLLCWMLMRNRMRGRKRAELPVLTSLGHNSNTQIPPRSFSGTQSLGAPTEVLKWQVELYDLGRELKGELDSKLIAVRSMVSAYDQAAKRLSELIRMAEQTKLASSSPMAEARRLAQLGWTTPRIATALGLSELEVAQLVDAAN